MFAVSNLEDAGNDLDPLRRAIMDASRQQYHWDEAVPLKWLALQSKLKRARQSGQRVIALDDVTKLSAEVGITTEAELRTLLVCMHGLGDIVFFDEPRLRDIVVLNPQWLIDSFRKVITLDVFHKANDPGRVTQCRALWRNLEENGILHEVLVDQVWDPTTKDTLLALMLKFNLLVPLPVNYFQELDVDVVEAAPLGDLYLVPCLIRKSDDAFIPPTSPDLSEVLIRFREDFVPIGLFSRLISCLIYDEGWSICNRIYHNVASFLPKGTPSAACVVLLLEDGFIEVRGVPLTGDDVTTPGQVALLLSEALDRLLHCLRVISRNVANPAVDFRLAVRCQCNVANRPAALLDIGRDGMKVMAVEWLLCRYHVKRLPTATLRPWFSGNHIKKVLGLRDRLKNTLKPMK